MFYKDQESCARWYTSDSGALALKRLQILLRYNICGWGRRGHKLLVLYGSNGELTEDLWEAGFDVTLHATCPKVLYPAQEYFGSRVDTVVSAIESLPFEDCAFDYAVVLGTADFLSSIPQAISELSRLVSTSCLVIFPNSCSSFFWEMRENQELVSFSNPRVIAKACSAGFNVQRSTWSSILLTPSRFWPTPAWGWANSTVLGLPIGAFAALRLDLAPTCHGTPLLLGKVMPSHGK